MTASPPSRLRVSPMSLESILGPEGPLRVAMPGGGSASDSTGGASNQHLMSDHALFLPPLSALFPIKHDHPAEVVQPLGGLPTKHDGQQQAFYPLAYLDRSYVVPRPASFAGDGHLPALPRPPPPASASHGSSSPVSSASPPTPPGLDLPHHTSTLSSSSSSVTSSTLVYAPSTRRTSFTPSQGGEGGGDASALDLLALVAQRNSASLSPPPPPASAPAPAFSSTSSSASTSFNLVPSSSPSSSSRPRASSSSSTPTTTKTGKRARAAGPTSTSLASTSAPSATGRPKKPRLGRSLDPEKTRTLLFPSVLPPRAFHPDPAEGYADRGVIEGNPYAPVYTHGTDSRTRVAFCQYCGEGALPTRMSGYGYHLMHSHNLSSHPPFVMPAPTAVRLAAAPDAKLSMEDACYRPATTLEGKCPFDGGDHGADGGMGRVCEGGGWHKLNGWRDAMNSHFGGRSLLVAGSSSE